MNNTIAIHNAEKDEIIVREMTAKEQKDFDELANPLKAEAQKIVEENAKKEEALKSALEKLAALGLTEAEIQALAG